MPWRYQPVIFSYRGTDEKSFWLIEVYFDEGGDVLRQWSAEVDKCAPAGKSLRGLRQDLAKMLVDASAWVPVRFEDLKVGMTFERALSLGERERIANFYNDYAAAIDAKEERDRSAKSN